VTCPRCDDNGYIEVAVGDRPDYFGNWDTNEVRCPDCIERRIFDVRKTELSVWEVCVDGQVVSRHATRDGAAVSCNQLNRAEGWDV